MKQFGKVLTAVALMLALALTLCSCGNAREEAAKEATEKAAAVVADSATCQAFTKEAVAKEDLSKITAAGVNAPSGRNLQPWHFTVISDAALLKQLDDDSPVPEDIHGKQYASKAGITAAPVAIVVACEKGHELDAGLAAQAMCVEAQILGYGTKILGSTKLALNGDKKAEYNKLLKIPDGMQHICVVLVGHPAEDPDATTGATDRKDTADVVTYLR